MKAMPVKHPKLIQEEAALSILTAADVIQHEGSGVIKPFDLTPPQFNVLRILRGAPEGLACGQIGERMISRDPDITRLLDKMEARSLIMRERSDQDRRVVTARISQHGLDLLKRADPVIRSLHEQQFQGMSEKQMRQIIELLSQINGKRGTTNE